MLKPDKDRKVIHYTNRQTVHSFTSEHASEIAEKLNELVVITHNDSYICKPKIDCVQMVSEMEKIHGTLTAQAPDLRVDSVLHVIAIMHDEIWKKVNNDDYPEYAMGDVEEIYYKGA